MSGFKINVPGSNFSLAVFAFLLNTNINIVNSQPLFETVEVYKCKESKLSAGYEIHVPSYPFKSKVVLRIKSIEAFPGCGSSKESPELREIELFYIQQELQVEEISNKMISDIESNKSSISLNGILNVKNHYYDMDEYCILSYASKLSETDPSVLKIKYCPEICSDEKDSQLCIRKCCPMGKVLDLNAGCGPSGTKTWTGFFYDEHFSYYSHNPISRHDGIKKFKKPHYFKESMKSICNGSNQYQEAWVNRKIDEIPAAKSKLLTNGTLIYISGDRKWEPLDSTIQFCIDGIQNLDKNHSFYSGEEQDQVVFVCLETVDESITANRFTSLYMYSLFMASSFYLATTIIFAFLWDKHNTHEWTIFSLALSQFFMCLFVGNAHRIGLNGDHKARHSILCVLNAILSHFFTLSSFTWLTVINFDLWATFRSFRARNNKDVNGKKFFLYSVYGWGAPLVVVIVGIILDDMFPDRESLVVVPEYGSNICYVVLSAQGPYIYYIMAIQLLITVTLSSFSCVKIFQFHKETSEARSSSNAGDRKMFWLYAKLSVILGTSWIFEFISWAASSKEEHQSGHQHWIWAIFDMYNLLTAVFIFIIFACKRNNFTQLAEKYSSLRPANDLFIKWKTRRMSEPSGMALSTRSSRDENARHGVQRNFRFNN